MKATTILTIFWVVLLMYVVLLPFSQAYHNNYIIERFVEDTPRPLTDFNNQAKRNLHFIPPHVSALASQRAAVDPDFSKLQDNVCINKISGINVSNEGLSLMVEHDVIYRLTSMCLALKTKDSIKGSFIPIDIESPRDYLKFMFLLLLNPLFIEFSMGSTGESSTSLTTDITGALYIKNDNQMTICSEGLGDFSGGRNTTVMLPYTELKGDFFNYDSSYVKGEDIVKKFSVPGALNVRAYYLNQQPTSQSFGTKILLSSEDSTKRFFDITQYPASSIKNDDKLKPTKFFSKMIENYVFGIGRGLGDVLPTFTIKFSVSLQVRDTETQYTDKHHALLELCMKQNKGDNCTSQIFYPHSDFTMNGNIVTVARKVVSQNKGESDMSPNLLAFSIGTSKNGCLFDDPAHFAQITVPFFTEDPITASVIVTISPTGVDVLMFWIPPSSMKLSGVTPDLQWIFTQKPFPKSNDFYKIFNDNNPKTMNSMFGGIRLARDSTTVPAVQFVQLGRVNFMKEMEAVTR